MPWISRGNIRKENGFFYSAAVVLLLTACAKFYSVCGEAKILRIQDELLHVGYRPLLLFAGLVELMMAIHLAGRASDLAKAGALLWLSVNFMAYRFGNYLLGITICPCLGTLTERLPLPRGYADHLLQLFILYWFLGSFYIVWRDWLTAQEAELGRQQARASASL